jgi:CHAD domain-containing protein
MRVAARRLRAAMQAFRPWLPVRVERYRAELGWVAAALGMVRDLDVQIERLDEWRPAAGEAEGRALDAVQGILRERRERARRRLLAVLDQRRYDSLVARFTALLRRGPPRAFEPGRVAVLAVAPGLLEKRYARVRKGGDGIRRGSPPEEYHALRIEAKKLRYALEFVGPIYGKPATAFAARLVELQDLLGLHQDAEVAIETLHELAHTASRRLGTETVLTMGAIGERYRRHAAELRAGFPAVYGPIRGSEWKALRRALERRQPQPADGQ